ncbi:hypothetical protein COCON_G00183920 [Conger conger]|uniref:Uncharacterized protein n=1 Tax=Conger conger TaxID=82655 RepID=A0A9Q1D5T9_CONCO|nr:hypothetical protein COCON_G00183920 [Conger conger]
MLQDSSGQHDTASLSQLSIQDHQLTRTLVCYPRVKGRRPTSEIRIFCCQLNENALKNEHELSGGSSPAQLTAIAAHCSFTNDSGKTKARFVNARLVLGVW